MQYPPLPIPQPASLVEREKVFMAAADVKRKDHETKRDAIIKPKPAG